MKREIRIGISGWTYAPWRGVFFPIGLPQRQELAYASSIFPTIEINGTFYSLMKPDTFAAWAEQVPEDFIFAVKGSRFITHIKRARDAAVPLANFFASGVLRLGAKLGPILWQFPPNFRFDPETLGDFLAQLPHDTRTAARLARHHDHRLKARAWLKSDATRPIRHAIEVRHESFVDPAFIDLLRAQNVALVCADTIAWPRLMDLTADFVYCRLHGSKELYRSGYGAAALDRWAKRAKAWAAGKPIDDGEFAGTPAQDARPREVFVYFDNTDKLRAPRDAQSLIRKLDVKWPPDSNERRANAGHTHARPAAALQAPP
jgi:uncharacterized protein YecE (DUF72 family)